MNKREQALSTGMKEEETNLAYRQKDKEVKSHCRELWVDNKWAVVKAAAVKGDS